MYVILGALGYQGEAILHYLYNTCADQLAEGLQIVATDVEIEPTGLNAYMFSDECPYDIRYMRFRFPEVNLATAFDRLPTFSWIKEDDVTVINCLPTEYILYIMKGCLHRGWNVLDLGGVTDVTSKQLEFDQAAIDKHITIVPDCGLAPGIVSSLAADILTVESDVRSINIYCGGIPKYPELPLSYAEVFYLDGVRKEYSGIALELRNGNIKAYPTLSGREFVPVSGFGLLEAARTSGGISLSVSDLDVLNLSYKTLRYPGHWNYVEKYIMSQEDPTEILKSMVEPVSSDNPDVIVLAIHTDYMDGDSDVQEFFWEYDYDNNISAMAQATGYTVGAVARKVHDGEIGVGVIGMHEITANEIIGYVKELPGQYRETPIAF
jgi:lysine 6-dehydrogenase